VNDGSKLKFIDANGDEEAVSRMTPVATSVAQHVNGTKPSADSVNSTSEERLSAVNFSENPEIVPPKTE
jgi:hypothetical protein